MHGTVTDAAGFLAWVVGPDGSNRFKAPKENEGWGEGSSASGLSESDVSCLILRTRVSSNTADISSLIVRREMIIARDSRCLVSGNLPIRCHAAHIAPKRRVDVGLTTLGWRYFLTEFGRYTAHYCLKISWLVSFCIWHVTDARYANCIRQVRMVFGQKR